MTNKDIIKFIDEFLREQEDVLHGTEGENCTKSRKYLSILEQQLTLTDVRKCSELKDANISDNIIIIERADGLIDVFKNYKCLGLGLDKAELEKLTGLSYIF